MAAQHTLVIAEKPSVAKSIAAVLGAKKRCEGYFEGNGYIVSWCYGHLIQLANAQEYDERYAKWSIEDLPIIPAKWKYNVAESTKDQFRTLKKLMADDRVGTVVCATDAGREGELIFRLVYIKAGCKKPVKRLWISSMEESAILDGFKSLRPGSDYDGLYSAALCRLQADWIVGINATRLFTKLYHSNLNVGRVMTPTLAMIVARADAVANFVPQPFYTVVLDCGTFSASGERLSDRSEAERIAGMCSGKTAVVTQLETKDKSEKPPKLYDLTTLQRDANRVYGFSAQVTLDAVQSLYEKKLTTYPRTDSRYITSDMAAGVPQLANVAAKLLGIGSAPAVNPKQIVNDSKVTDHHALMPTVGAGSCDLHSLQESEREILMMIALRLVNAVGDPFKFTETAVVLNCEDVSFSVKGKVTRDAGWKGVEARLKRPVTESETEDEDAGALPPLKKGQTFTASTSIKEGKTSPPKHYTEDTLLSAMENAGNDEKDLLIEDAERKGIGTPATRAGIIEKLVKLAFVERKGSGKTKHLLPTQNGIALCSVVPDILKSARLTAEWEQKLKQIERGQISPEVFMRAIAGFTGSIVAENVKNKVSSPAFTASGSQNSDREVIGKCPRCGQPVYESEKNFRCSSRNCSFVLWKDNRFFAAKKKSITKTVAKALLKKGRVAMKGLYSEKSDKKYDATVVMDVSGDKVMFRLEFGK